MPKLNRQQLNGRLARDYQICNEMNTNSKVIDVEAYKNPDDLRNQKNLIVSENDGHLATHYRVAYHIKTLIAKGEYSSDPVVIHIDLMANGDYPYSAPTCMVISPITPWSPHFQANSPVCLGVEVWVHRAPTVWLGDLLIHIARLLNFDELLRSPGYVGWNKEAIDYWRKILKEQPINPNLIYPVLPDFMDVTATGFMPLQSAQSAFKSVSRNNADKKLTGFTPSRQ